MHRESRRKGSSTKHIAKVDSTTLRFRHSKTIKKRPRNLQAAKLLSVSSPVVPDVNELRSKPHQMLETPSSSMEDGKKTITKVDLNLSFKSVATRRNAQVRSIELDRRCASSC